MNLGAARRHAGMTQAEAAEKSGIALGTLRRWEQGVNEPSIASLARLAQLYEVTTDTIIGTRYADKAIAKGTSAAWPLPYVDHIEAGTPRDAIGFDGERRWASPTVVARHPHAFFLGLRDDSMNMLFPDGCLVAVDPDERKIVSGKEYVVVVDDCDAVPRQVFLAGTKSVLHTVSSNPAHKDRAIDRGDSEAASLSVIGRVVWYVGPED